MMTQSIPRDQTPGQEAQARDQDWEEECYRLGCASARREAVQRLQALEQRLHAHRPASWKDKGWRERTLVTRFGDLRIRRRVYQDEHGTYHFLLDEYLGWPPAQVATPRLTEQVVELASRMPFREVVRTVTALTAGVLSPATIHRLTQRVAQRAVEADHTMWEQGVQRGGAPPAGDRVVPTLYVEADGLWVHLQREGTRYYEVKSAIAYEGWQRLPQNAERYALVGKRVYCHGDDTLPFWEVASLAWSRRWDLSRIPQVVIGGDGAPWIDEGRE
ncbi:MAG: hypothetical protein D6736_00225, partial [Nitrospinota bacterium]